MSATMGNGPRSEFPVVSVVVPCYNYEHFVGAALSSVLTERDVDLEVIVVDDASTDGSLDVVREIAAKDRRVTVIAHSTNYGHIDTFNECLASGTGKYVVKLDADDLLTPGQLSRAIKVLETHPTVGFVYGHPILFKGDELPRVPASPTNWGWRVWSGHDWLWRRVRRAENVIRQPEVMMRRSVLDAVGGHSDTVPAASDFNLWLRMACVADVAFITRAVQGAYRIHSASMQRTIHAGRLTDIAARRDAFEHMFASMSRSLPQADEMRRNARARLGAEALEYASIHRDAGEPDVACEYLHLALDLDASVANGAKYKRVASREASSRFDAGVRYRSIYRDLTSRWDWWRWRLTGH